jgi:hypothetical protein
VETVFRFRYNDMRSSELSTSAKRRIFSLRLGEFGSEWTKLSSPSSSSMKKREMALDFAEVLVSRGFPFTGA